MIRSMASRNAEVNKGNMLIVVTLITRVLQDV